MNKARKNGRPDSVISPSLPAAWGISNNVTYAPTPIKEACPKFNKPVKPKWTFNPIAANPYIPAKVNRLKSILNGPSSFRTNTK